MIRVKRYYHICDEVRNSIRHLDDSISNINLIPLKTKEIAGFLVCDKCLGEEPEIEGFFNKTFSGLSEYRFKKRKKLRAWSSSKHIRVFPFAKMRNDWWAGESPKIGDRVNHCHCKGFPAVFVLKFDHNPLDYLKLEHLINELEYDKEARRLILSDMPSYFLLCGTCYESLHPDDLIEGTEQTVFNKEAEKELGLKICSYMNLDTYVDRFALRVTPTRPDVGDLVAACDHMESIFTVEGIPIKGPEFPIHYWNIEGAAMELEINQQGKTKTEIIKWLQCCNKCDGLHSDAIAVLDNSCVDKLHIIWTEDDNADFPIDSSDYEKNFD